MLVTFTRKTMGSTREKVAAFEIDYVPSKGENVTIHDVMTKNSRVFRVMDTNTTYHIAQIYKDSPPVVHTSVEVFVE